MLDPQQPDRPDSHVDPVIEVYQQNVDRTLLLENLRLTPAERFERFVQRMKVIFELQRAGKAARSKSP
ncbi:MAG: hypothetical protein GTO76_12580 [Planctomycetales bacterium]|nr:hypothetical protein [Planctomycetales bacterium]NIN78558.1 hypothetical protein [Planctomycetales bacterium]NIO35751.1 hypothetical protein [Planctomycetales bacterium]NIP05628.1 hypothetical protein [Planctomycetales bacterium]